MQTLGYQVATPAPGWASGLSAGPVAALRRLLLDWGLKPGLPPQSAFGERLAAWLDWRDAIALSQALTTAPSAQAADQAAVLDWANAALDRLRLELQAGFASTVLVGEIGEELTMSVEAVAAFRLHHVQQQRAMAARIATLRERLRVRLAAASTELARLASLDAVFDQALAGRERQLLAALPAQLPQLAEVMQVQFQTRWRPRLWAELQRALQLELELRLQPVLGLVAALEHKLAATTASADLPI